MTDSDEAAKIAEMIRGIPVAMLTTRSVDGGLRSRPLGTQDVDFDGDVYFVVRRDSSAVADLTVDPEVAVAYAGSSTWVSLAGTARVVQDSAKLREVWDTFTDAWIEGGPDSPENVLLHVDARSAQYWDAPGSKVTQVLNLVKAKVTGERYEGDSGRVEL